VVAEFKAARAAEYDEIAREAESLLQHIARETEHREFSYAELEELEADLTKLRRWTDQVQARDYFPGESHTRADLLLEACDQALATFLDRAAESDAPTP
jgi:hypothetical protein